MYKLNIPIISTMVTSLSIAVACVAVGLEPEAAEQPDCPAELGQVSAVSEVPT